MPTCWPRAGSRRWSDLPGDRHDARGQATDYRARRDPKDCAAGANPRCAAPARAVIWLGPGPPKPCEGSSRASRVCASPRTIHSQPRETRISPSPNSWIRQARPADLDCWLHPCSQAAPAGRRAMAQQPTSSVAARVRTPLGLVVGIAEGSRLVFGKGPDADLTIAAGRVLCRRAGVSSAVVGGVWVANISRMHSLSTEGDGFRIRLPRMEEHGEPSGGWFMRTGTTLVGSRAMLDEGQPLAVMVARP